MKTPLNYIDWVTLPEVAILLNKWLTRTFDIADKFRCTDNGASSAEGKRIGVTLQAALHQAVCGAYNYARALVQVTIPDELPVASKLTHDNNYRTIQYSARYQREKPNSCTVPRGYVIAGGCSHPPR